MSDFQIRAEGKPSEGFRRNIELLKKRTPKKYREISILISQPRTGSTMVCDYITKCSEIGWCDEWFNPFFLKSVANEINVKSVDTILNWIISRAASQNGRASINIQVPDIIYWQNKGIDVLRMGTKSTYLYRKNKIQQAISLAKAVKTKKYYSLNGGGKNTELSINEIIFAINEISKWDAEYVRNIKKEDILEVAYEDLSDSEEINKILMRLGCESKIQDLPKTKLRKQRTSRDIEYSSRLLEYFEEGNLSIFSDFNNSLG